MKVPLELTAFRGEVMGEKNGKIIFLEMLTFGTFRTQKKEED